MKFILILILSITILGCTFGCKHIYVSSLKEAYSLGIDSTQVVKVEKIQGSSSSHGNILRVYYKDK